MLHISDGFQFDWSTLYREEIATLSTVGAHFLSKAKQMFLLCKFAIAVKLKTIHSHAFSAHLFEEKSDNYSKTCLKRPLKNRQNKGLKDKWKLKEGRKYCRMLSWSILQYFRHALSDNRS